VDQVHADFLGRSAAIKIRKQTIFLTAKLLLHSVIDARRVRDDEASD